MRLLDLFCGAGGAAMGYHRAGFDEIVGVDNRPQTHYPFQFIQDDALEFLARYGDHFDLIHASPPCQRYSRTANIWRRDYPDLLGPTRVALEATGKPWVIENVVGAPFRWHIELCGAMFGLRVYRHRRFEASVLLLAPAHLTHVAPVTAVGRQPREGEFICVAGHFANVQLAGQAMGIDWMNRAELSQAIPPAYTEFIGRAFLA